MIENLDVESWERLASAASAEHEKNLVTRNQLTRQRAAAALNALVNGDTDVVAGIVDELCGLEARIVGHSEVCRMIQRGLEAAIEIQCADATLEKIALTRISAQRRAELAHQVDDALQQLATVMTAYLDSLDGQHPSRASGNLNRAFWWQFSKTRNRPSWWRQAVTGLSESPRSMATVAPLSATTDPALMESDALEQAALKRKQEALETLKALTLTKPLTPAKSRANRKIEALEIAA
jgi:hypothetical protein